MIFDKLVNADNYRGLSYGIDRAFDFLQYTDLAGLDAGIHEIEGENIFAVCAEYDTKTISESKTEAHKKYIDVQYIINGNEKIYIAEVSGIKKTVEYDGKNDVAFYEDKIECEITARAGYFAIFFPEDAHMPGVSESGNSEKIKKVVIKVHV